MILGHSFSFLFPKNVFFSFSLFWKRPFHFSPFFSFLFERRHLLLLLLHHPCLFLVFIGTILFHFFLASIADQLPQSSNIWSFLSGDLVFGSHDLWRDCEWESELWEKKWGRDLGIERCELQGFGWFWTEAEGSEFWEITFKLLGVNSGSWGIRTVEATRGSRHRSGAECPGVVELSVRV